MLEAILVLVVVLGLVGRLGKRLDRYLAGRNRSKNLPKL